MNRERTRMIRKRLIQLWLVFCLLPAMAGCSQKAAPDSPQTPEAETAGGGAAGEGKSISEAIESITANSEETEMTGSDGYKKALAFMIEKYGFTVEELLGLDVEALIEDYHLDTEEYTKEEVAEIIGDQREYYLLDPADEAFSLLGNTNEVNANSADLPENADIAKIAIYINSGSLQKRIMFDLEDDLYYVDDGTPYVLEAEQIEIIKAGLKEAGVSTWDHYYENSGEQETTGSLRWKLVILLRDGTECAYGGYTKDMSTLPDNYDKLEKAFNEAAGSE